MYAFFHRPFIDCALWISLNANKISHSLTTVSMFYSRNMDFCTTFSKLALEKLIILVMPKNTQVPKLQRVVPDGDFWISTVIAEASLSP